MGLSDFKRGRTIDDVGASNGTGSSFTKVNPALRLGRAMLNAIEGIVEEILRRQTGEARREDDLSKTNETAAADEKGEETDKKIKE